MSDTVKLIIEIPKEDYLNAKRINWANVRPECVDDYEYQIAHGTPLDNDSESAEVQAYFDGQAYGWEEGRKDLCDKISAEINEELRDAVDGSERLGMYSALRIIEKYKKEEINE